MQSFLQCKGYIDFRSLHEMGAMGMLERPFNDEKLLNPKFLSGSKRHLQIRKALDNMPFINKAKN